MSPFFVMRTGAEPFSSPQKTHPLLRSKSPNIVTGGPARRRCRKHPSASPVVRGAAPPDPHPKEAFTPAGVPARQPPKAHAPGKSLPRQRPAPTECASQLALLGFFRRFRATAKRPPARRAPLGSAFRRLPEKPWIPRRARGWLRQKCAPGRRAGNRRCH